MRHWDKHIIKKIRQGYYSAVYFTRTKEILLKENNLQTVTMQIFQKNNAATLCGITHVIELLKIATGYFEKEKWILKWDRLEVKALSDGARVSAGEPVMHIKGPYAYFAHLESLYLGILARQTRIATNARACVKSAGHKRILFFADRFDYFLNQEIDGYAAHVGGVTSVCTPAQASSFAGKPIGTIPHALIAINNADTTLATKQFQKYFPKKHLVALVDFDNDSVTTSLAAAKMFGKKLWGVRLDTAENMVDVSLEKYSEKNNELHGVNPTLVRMIRKALDKEGFQHIKIIVSGGFNAERIVLFEKEKVPVDVYAVGSSMLVGRNDFTADIVKVGDVKIAKVGREYMENKKMKIYK